MLCEEKLKLASNERTEEVGQQENVATSEHNNSIYTAKNM